MPYRCKGIPSTQIARQLGVIQKGAWFLTQRIRELWLLSKTDNDKLDGTVEVGENFIGGKDKE